MASLSSKHFSQATTAISTLFLNKSLLQVFTCAPEQMLQYKRPLALAGNVADSTH